MMSLEHIKEDELVMRNLYKSLKVCGMESGSYASREIYGRGGYNNCSSAHVHVECRRRGGMPCKTVFVKGIESQAGGFRFQGEKNDGLCFTAFSVYDGFAAFRWQAEKRRRRAEPSCVVECNFWFCDEAGVFPAAFRNKLSIWRKYNSSGEKIDSKKRWVFV